MMNAMLIEIENKKDYLLGEEEFVRSTLIINEEELYADDVDRDGVPNDLDV